MTSDKRQWIEARLEPLPLRGRTKQALDDRARRRKQLSEAYDRMTGRKAPVARSYGQRLTEKELALVGRLGYGGKR